MCWWMEMQFSFFLAIKEACYYVCMQLIHAGVGSPDDDDVIAFPDIFSLFTVITAFFVLSWIFRKTFKGEANLS